MELRTVIVLGCLLAAPLAWADGAYKWVDSEGVVHYSDRPQEGAEIVNLSEYSRPTGARIGPRTTTIAATDEPDAESQQRFRYESLAVASPGAEETLWNIEGVLNVSLALNPGLQSGHQVRVYFDGAPRMVPGTSFQIEEVYRGVHNIQAEVIDESGQLMIRSQPNRFYVQQNTVITRPRT
ncbi:MAG: DUF4124 domain-containing protein [Gammaproteobacteria bacterium]|nr:DUF4124 domain-containing protein [Gammaproteobacteria bacterium]